MSGDSNAIEAAAAAMLNIRQPTGSPPWTKTDDVIQAMAAAAHDAIAPIIEASVRAKIAEETARALLAVDPVEWALAGMNAGLDAAAIARGHAFQGPREAVERRNPPDAYPTKGPTVSDAPRAAPVLSARGTGKTAGSIVRAEDVPPRKPGGPVLPPQPYLYDPAVDGPIQWAE